MVRSGYRSLKGKKEVILGGADNPENIFNWAQQSQLFQRLEEDFESRNFEAWLKTCNSPSQKKVLV